jgi:hypothetical protein
MGNDRYMHCGGRGSNYEAFGVYAAVPEDGGRLHRVADAPLVQTSSVSKSVGGKANACVVVGWSGSGSVGPNGDYSLVAGVTAFTLDPASAASEQRNTVAAHSPKAIAAAPGVAAMATSDLAGSTLDVYSLSPTCDVVRIATP